MMKTTTYYIESLGWDYCKEEVFVELFSPEEFFEEEDSDYILEEVNVVYGARKFEPLDLQTKGKKKIKPLIKKPRELELKSLPNHLKYAYLGENETRLVIISAQLNVEKRRHFESAKIPQEGDKLDHGGHSRNKPILLHAKKNQVGRGS